MCDQVNGFQYKESEVPETGKKGGGGMYLGNEKECSAKNRFHLFLEEKRIRKQASGCCWIWKDMSKTGKGSRFQIRYSCRLRANLFISLFLYFLAQKKKKSKKGGSEGAKSVRTFFFPGTFSRAFFFSFPFWRPVLGQ
jgi:hypothetical protein